MTSASSLVPATATAPLVSWTWKRFEQLSGDDVYDLLALRSAAFVVEQRCVFLDADGLDRSAWHLLGRIAGQGASSTLAACLRCLDPGVKYREPSIGRVITASAFRSLGLGRALMREGIVRARRAWPGDDIVIAAQQRLESFYRGLDFRAEGLPYVEDDIDHIAMRLVAAPRDDVGTSDRRTR